MRWRSRSARASRTGSRRPGGSRPPEHGQPAAAGARGHRAAGAALALAARHAPCRRAGLAAGRGRGWPAGTSSPRRATLDDPLLFCLVALTQLLERPTSPEALKAGLPLEEGRLTPELALRAAARAGLSARLVRRDARPDQRRSRCPASCCSRAAAPACWSSGWPASARVGGPAGDRPRRARDAARRARRSATPATRLFARPEVRFDRRAEQVETRPASTAGSGARWRRTGRSTPRSCWRRC